jgi:hypothetical protein
VRAGGGAHRARALEVHRKAGLSPAAKRARESPPKPGRAALAAFFLEDLLLPREKAAVAAPAPRG